MKGHCGHDESELQVFWVDRAYALKMLFVKVTASEAGGAHADSGCGWVGALSARAAHEHLFRSAGKSQHVQGTRGNVEAEQSPVCLRLLREDPL